MWQQYTRFRIDEAISEAYNARFCQNLRACETAMAAAQPELTKSLSQPADVLTYYAANWLYCIPAPAQGKFIAPPERLRPTSCCNDFARSNRSASDPDCRIGRTGRCAPR